MEPFLVQKSCTVCICREAGRPTSNSAWIDRESLQRVFWKHKRGFGFRPSLSPSLPPLDASPSLAPSAFTSRSSPSPSALDTEAAERERGRRRARQRIEQEGRRRTDGRTAKCCFFPSFLPFAWDRDDNFGKSSLCLSTEEEGAAWYIGLLVHMAAS